MSAAFNTPFTAGIERRLISLGIVTALGAILAACSAAPVADDAKRNPVNVRVMTFNIEWGGTHVSFDNVVEAIRLANADVVGIQEAEGNLERLANALDWHFDERNYVISRFPLFDPPGADGRYVLVEIAKGYVIAIANLHLPSDPYGPDAVRDGASIEDVLEIEHATRMPMLQPYLDILPALLRAGMPVFLTGDFNAPTHTDWTADMVGQRPFLSRAIDWPVSRAATKAGYNDTWRVLYPDVKAHPGLTWWAARPPLPAYAPGADDAQDRIDLIWFAGPATPVDASIVGEPGGPEVSISVSPWPSDHRAVVATYAVEPAPLPALVTTARHVYTEGDTVRMDYNFPGGDIANVELKNLDKDRTVAVRKSLQRRGRFDLASLARGHYRISATTNAGHYEREFWILPHGATPAISIDNLASSRPAGAVIRWENAPGFRNDYVALVHAGTRDDAESMLAFAYTRAEPEGSLALAALFPEDGRPPPGSYVLRLMKDDGYDILAETPAFEIR